MDKMLLAVFDAESKAFKAKEALRELVSDDVIEVYAQAIVARNADGSATVRQNDDPIPVGTAVGTSVGALIGLLGGPAGLAIGAAAGLIVGASVDVDHARLGEDFVADVKQKLLPKRFALVAEIEEDSPVPVDLRMEALGGTVYRWPLSEVKHRVNDQNVAAMKVELAQMKAKHAKAHADRKAKLQEKINQLDSRIQAQLKKAKQRRRVSEARTQAKVDVLHAKARTLNAKTPARSV